MLLIGVRVWQHHIFEKYYSHGFYNSQMYYNFTRNAIKQSEETSLKLASPKLDS